MDIFFTIIVPLYNKEKYIERTIQSIINQNYYNYEIIVIDDRSTDSSFNKIKTFKDIMRIDEGKMKIFRNKQNKGVSYTRNKAIEVSKGEYILFLDADDEIQDRNLLSKTNEFIKKYNAEYIFLTRNYYNKFLKPSIFNISKKNVEYIEKDYYKIKNKKNFIIESNFPFGGSGSAIISKKSIGKNRFDTEEFKFEDWLFFINIFIEQDAFFYSKESIYINYDENSVFKQKNSPKKKVEKIPKLYYLLQDNSWISIRKKFFWIWMKGMISNNLNKKYIKEILKEYKHLIKQNNQINKYSIYSYCILFIYSINIKIKKR